MKSRGLFLTLVIATCLLIVTSSFAQNGTGSITGHVTDASGALVTGASVTALNVATGVRITASTNAAGIYLLQNLIPGTYTVDVKKSGFKSMVHPGILLQVSDNLGLDFHLEIGTVAETMTVTAEAPELRTEDAQEGEVVNGRMIENLPTFADNGGVRDPLALVALAGNTLGSGRAGWEMQVQDAGNFVTNGPNTTRVNGGVVGDLEYLVDGVPITGALVHNVANSAPTQDDVQEFKVITNGMDAEYGRLSGGAVEVTTKSGTNAIHGQLFEYHQDEFFNANTWSNDGQCASGLTISCAKPLFHQNDFGFAVGGPVRIPHVYNGKDKTFWFANAEWTRYKLAGSTQIGETISAQELNSLPNPYKNGAIATPFPCPANSSSFPNPTGDCANLEDIGTAAGNASGSDPYPNLGDIYNVRDVNGVLPMAGGDGRSIPISELNQAALHYLFMLPAPNHAALFGGTGGNYLYTTPQTVNNLNWNVRVDHVINSKERIYGRFAHYSATNVTSAIYPNFASPENVVKGAFSASLNYDYAISPTLMLNLTAGGNYSPIQHGNYLAANSPGNDTTGWGFGPGVTDIMGTQMPSMKNGPNTELGSAPFSYACSNGSYQCGMQGYGVFGFANTNFDYNISLTKILNRHTLKFGYDARRYYDDYTNSRGANPNQNGDVYSFASAGVAYNAPDNGEWGSEGNANGLGAFLYGLDSWTQLTAVTTRNLAENYYSAYFQDDFKVNSRLTLNLGVRWEMETPVTERNNNITVWDPLAPSPFTLNPSYVSSGGQAAFDANLVAQGISPAVAATIPAPAWFTQGAFFSGAQEFVDTPEHRARTATYYHPWNFAPRLGFAYQATPLTVVRGSFGIFYLPTGGNLTDYADAPGVSYSNERLNTADHPADYSFNGTGLIQTMSNPFPNPPGDYLVDAHNSALANVQSAAGANGTGGILITSHMPMEYDWHLGVQRQLPNKWVVELDYSGHHSSTLLGPNTPSRFPANLYVPQNAAIYGSGLASNGLCATGQSGTGLNGACYMVTSPTAGQIPGTGQTGASQPLSWLMFPYPYFGPVYEEDANIGTENFNSGNLRVERRFANGFQMLLNYTYSKDLTDVGGANGGATPTNGGAGTNGPSFQGIYGISSAYGLSPADQTHRISAYYSYDLPYGRGRRWGNSPNGIGQKVLDGVAGGWQLAGTFLWASGTPVSIAGGDNGNVDANWGIYDTFASLAPGYTLHQVVNSESTKRAVCASSMYCSNASPALNIKAILNGGSGQETFTPGNIPYVLTFFRNPSSWNANISVMKHFPLNSDGTRFFELRLEGENFLNHPGYGGYNTTLWQSTYGDITGTANTERHVQIAGKIVF